MTSAGLRASFLGASTAVHLAAFVTFGHAPVSPSSDARRVEDIVVDELVSPVDEPGAGPAPLATSRAALAALPTHKHAYPVAPDHDAHPHDASLLHVPFAPPLASPHEELAAQGPEPMVTAPAPARFILVVGTGEARRRPGDRRDDRGRGVRGSGREAGWLRLRRSRARRRSRGAFRTGASRWSRRRGPHAPRLLVSIAVSGQQGDSAHLAAPCR